MGNAPRHRNTQSRYEAAKKAGGADGNLSGEKQIDTHLTIEGMAPSDLQVAAYIEQLGFSTLINDVALVESKEKKVDDTSFRHFKLNAMLSKEVHLTKEDVEEIKSKAEHSVYHF